MYILNCFLELIYQAFVVTFTSRADRDYYISEDPVHIAFTKTLSSIDDVLVVDFED